MILIYGMLNISTAVRIRRTKKSVVATRRTAWVENLTGEEAEKYAKNHFVQGIATLLIGLFLLGCFIILIWK